MPGAAGAIAAARGRDEELTGMGDGMSLDDEPLDDESAGAGVLDEDLEEE